MRRNGNVKSIKAPVNLPQAVFNCSLAFQTSDFSVITEIIDCFFYHSILFNIFQFIHAAHDELVGELVRFTFKY